MSGRGERWVRRWERREVGRKVRGKSVVVSGVGVGEYMSGARIELNVISFTCLSWPQMFIL